MWWVFPDHLIRWTLGILLSLYMICIVKYFTLLPGFWSIFCLGLMTVYFPLRQSVFITFLLFTLWLVETWLFSEYMVFVFFSAISTGYSLLYYTYNFKENKNGFRFYFGCCWLLLRPFMYSCLCAVLSFEVTAHLSDKIHYNITVALIFPANQFLPSWITLVTGSWCHLISSCLSLSLIRSSTWSVIQIHWTHPLT